jgi:CRISPR-associated protein Cmr6
MNPKQQRQKQSSFARGEGERTEEIRYPVPPASAAAWRKYQSARVHNPGLVFERFVRDWGWYEQRGDKEAKQKAWKEIEPIVSKGDEQLLNEFNARWQLDAQAISALVFTLKTDWRFITGLGRKGPLEAGFTFNRYGFPILPGSSVKGIARAWAFYQLAELLKASLEHIPNHSDSEDEPDDRKDLDKASPLNRLERIVSKDDDVKYRRAFTWYYGENPEAFTLAEQFRAIFGTTSNAGGAVFLDAIPTHVPKLELDIMNPHFPDYYQGTQFPTDWQSPKPVFFLTVAPNTEFRFAVGWRGKVNKELQKCAREWLEKGLQELGAGAKTSAGYGYFKPDGAVEQKTQAAQTAQMSAPVAPAQPVRPSTRHTAFGKVRYESGKPYVRSEDGKSWRVNLKELGMEALKEKTVVEIEYEEFEDGPHKIVRVTKKGG